jgi:hypothetical protein
MAAAMGGDVGVESVEGKGSTFWSTVSLGQANTADVAAAGGEEAAELSAKSIEGLRVLLAEDNQIKQDIVIEMLRTMGCETALAQAANGQPQLAADPGAEENKLRELRFLISLPFTAR